MPLVPAKCTSCGAVLKVDDTKEQCFCEFCRTTFFVEQAINNYTINNEINIKDSEVHIHSGLSPEDKIKNALSILDVHKDYKKAEELFFTAIEESPDNYMSWWGLTRAITQDFSTYGFNMDEMETVQRYAESAIKICNDKSSDIKSKWSAYHDTYLNLCQLYVDERKQMNTRERLNRGSMGYDNGYDRFKTLSRVAAITGIVLIIIGMIAPAIVPAVYQTEVPAFISILGLLSLIIVTPTFLVLTLLNKQKAIQNCNTIIYNNQAEIKRIDPSNKFLQVFEEWYDSGNNA